MNKPTSFLALLASATLLLASCTNNDQTTSEDPSFAPESSQTQTSEDTTSDIASSDETTSIVDTSDEETSLPDSSDVTSEGPRSIYNSADDPLTALELAQILESHGNTSSTDYTEGYTYITGEVISSSYNSKYNSYNIYLEAGDYEVEIYSGVLDSSITGTYTADDALLGATVTAYGYARDFVSGSSHVYEIAYQSSHGFSPVITSLTWAEDAFTLDVSTLSLTVGGKGGTVTASFLNSAYTGSLTFASLDTSIATVSQNGLVATITPVSDGTTTITATGDQGYSKTVAVTVISAASLSDISAIYEGEDDDVFTVTGVIAQFTYGYSGKSNFYLVDKTDSILVYPNGKDISSLEVGNTVTVTGYKDHYQSSSDASVGTEIGYYGAVELVATSDISLVSSEVSEIPMDSIEEVRIKTLAETDFRENDLSSHIYKVKTTIVESAQTGFTNYYFYDLSMDQSMYTYSTISGSDYSWLSEYDQTSHYALIAVHSMRPRDEAWRIVPVSVGEEVSATDEDTATFALDRLEDQFLDKYTGSQTIELLSQDTKLTEATVEYACDSDYSAVIGDGTTTTLHIDGDHLETFHVTIYLTYKGIEYTRTVSITVAAASTYDTITIAEAKASAEGTEVYIQGVYVKFTANNAGLYLVDSTGIIVVNYSGLNIDDYKEGELMTFRGTVTLDFARTGIYDGHNRLSNAELLEHDGQVHEWDKSIVTGERTVSDIYNNFDVSEVQNIYKVNGYVKLNTSSSHYSNYRLYDAEGSSYLTLYCSSASQLSWLNEYDDIVQDYYLYIRDTNSSGYARVEILGIAA